MINALNLAFQVSDDRDLMIKFFIYDQGQSDRQSMANNKKPCFSMEEMDLERPDLSAFKRNKHQSSVRPANESIVSWNWANSKKSGQVDGLSSLGQIAQAVAGNQAQSFKMRLNPSSDQSFDSSLGSHAQRLI